MRRAVKKTVKKATKGKKSRPSKEKKAAGAKNAAAMKKAGKGIFAPKTLSPALAAICGKKVMPRTEVTKQIWVYIKKKVRRFFFLTAVADLIHPRSHPSNAPHNRAMRLFMLGSTFAKLDVFCCAGLEPGPHHQAGCHAQDDLPGALVRLHRREG